MHNGDADAHPGPVDTSPGSTPARTMVVWATLVVYVFLAVAYASVWEIQHDEGFSFDITVARPGALLSEQGAAGVPDVIWPDGPAPIVDLYAYFDADNAHDFAATRAALGDATNFNPPLYYVLLHVWIRIVGNDGLGVRVLGILIGLVSLLGLRRLAARALPLPWAAEIVVLMMACAPWFHAVSTFLRPYGLALCAALWATAAALEWHHRLPARDGVGDRRARRRWFVVFVVASVVGLLSVYHAMLVFAWHGVLLLLLSLSAPRGRRMGALGAAALAGLLVALAFLPWLSDLLGHLSSWGERVHFSKSAEGDTDFARPLGLLLGRFALAEAFTGAARDVFRMALVVLAALTYPWAVASFHARFLAGVGRGTPPAAGEPGRGLSARVARCLWWSAPVAPGLVFAADQVRGTTDLFISKYCFFVLPLLVLLVARAWLSLSTRLMRTLGVAAWIALLLAATIDIVAERKREPSEFEAVAAALAEHDSADHLVVVSSLRQGFLAPFLACLRDAGVDQVQVAYATEGQLARLLAESARLRGMQRLSLVNYDASLRHGAARGQSDWFGTVPPRLRQSAKIGGWSLETREIGGSSGYTEVQGLPATLYMGVNHKAFNGPN